eukprot:926392-Rhodomonas_salina.4
MPVVPDVAVLFCHRERCEIKRHKPLLQYKLYGNSGLVQLISHSKNLPCPSSARSQSPRPGSTVVSLSTGHRVAKL